MFTRIDHIDLLPSDVERTLRFYQDVLGFRLAARQAVNSPVLKEVIYLQLGNTMLEMLAARGPVAEPFHPARVGYRALALEVEDMARTLEFLASKQIPISWGPTDLGTSIRAEIQDPDGLPIELRQWRTRPG